VPPISRAPARLSPAPLARGRAPGRAAAPGLGRAGLWGLAPVLPPGATPFGSGRNGDPGGARRPSAPGPGLVLGGGPCAPSGGQGGPPAPLRLPPAPPQPAPGPGPHRGHGAPAPGRGYRSPGGRCLLGSPPGGPGNGRHPGPAPHRPGGERFPPARQRRPAQPAPGATGAPAGPARGLVPAPARTAGNGPGLAGGKGLAAGRGHPPGSPGARAGWHGGCWRLRDRGGAWGE